MMPPSVLQVATVERVFGVCEAKVPRPARGVCHRTLVPKRVLAVVAFQLLGWPAVDVWQFMHGSHHAAPSLEGKRAY